MIRAYLIDDERPAIDRLCRMLDADGRVEILGTSTDPAEALTALAEIRPDLLFLDISMPVLSGFELLAALPDPPLVVFTTAYSEYALDAFEADSIDYLLKPIEPAQLDRALAKAERFIRGAQDYDIRTMIDRMTAMLPANESRRRLTHLASRYGQKIVVVDLAEVSHLFAEDKLTFAATAERAYVIDQTIAELEQKLDPTRFVRIHRGIILNLDHLSELHTGFAGRMIVRLKGPERKELSVSRSRVGILREKLGL